MGIPENQLPTKIEPWRITISKWTNKAIESVIRTLPLIPVPYGFPTVWPTFKEELMPVLELFQKIKKDNTSKLHLQGQYYTESKVRWGHGEGKIKFQYHSNIDARISNKVLASHIKNIIKPVEMGFGLWMVQICK